MANIVLLLVPLLLIFNIISLTLPARAISSCNGCDAEHAGQPPCKNNIVDGSSAVWNALGLNQDLGNVGTTWSMA